MTRHDNTGAYFRGHIFIDGGVWPSWETYARYTALHGTYSEHRKEDQELIENAPNRVERG